MNKPELSLMMTHYDRTHALFSGAVTIEGAKLNVCPPPVQGDACYKPVYEQFDIAEMSLSWYVMARLRGEPLVALPIFPLRMFIQPYLFCREPSAIERPKISRVNESASSNTASPSAYGRAAFSKNTMASTIQRITGSPANRKARAFKLPAISNSNSRTTISKRCCSTASSTRCFCPTCQKPFAPAIRACGASSPIAVQPSAIIFKPPGYFPITHTMVVHERLLAKHPWLCQQLVNAFNEADRRCQIDYEYPKRFSFPTAVLFLEEEEKRFGKNSWSHGLQPNRKVLEKFVAYAHDQGYIPYQPALEDIFAPLSD